MTRTKGWLVFAGIVLTVVIVQSAFMLSVLSPAPRVDEPPRAENRVVYPLGFSIIKPERTRAVFNEDGLTILPDGGRSRYTPVVGVRQLGDRPDDAEFRRNGFRDGTFQGGAALVFAGPSGEYNAWKAVTVRGGTRYEVMLLIPGVEPNFSPSADWMTYLNTFAAPQRALTE